MEERNHINGEVSVGLGGMKSGKRLKIALSKYPYAVHRWGTFTFLNANTTS